ncbi:acyl carrier protein [Methylocucumis oryzae]|uniref:Acyl carrier protein n=1 Tax=Methylocucumis oryzae TaxID=1632867 RepID=A0A0F3IFR4_9GAMM|nr:acyl carrier protein [Methylocucumis oryzae]KJV05388.1 acyl carrier protein [Methylocucumis oryzae]
MSRDEILLMVQHIMADMFELDEQRITLDARLYEDLDFDSIDAVDMIVKLRDTIGRELRADDFKNSLTIADVVEAIFKLTNA